MKLRLQVTRLLVVPATLLALLTHHTYSEGSFADIFLEAGGLLLLLLAGGGRIWAGAYVVGRKNRALVIEGPFSLVRNPLYFFSFLAFIGAGLSFGSVILAAVFALTFLTVHWPTIRSEERVLEELFGDAYRRYCSQVPRFIPALRRPHTQGTVALDSAVFFRTVNESLAIPLIFIVAQVTEWAKLSGLLPVLFRLP